MGHLVQSLFYKGGIWPKRGKEATVDHRPQTTVRQLPSSSPALVKARCPHFCDQNIHSFTYSPIKDSPLSTLSLLRWAGFWGYMSDQGRHSPHPFTIVHYIKATQERDAEACWGIGV